MTDIFDNTIICKKCNKEMKKAELIKDGFKIRVLICPICGDKIIHPHDAEEYRKFKELKHKSFRVKMRIVGNSYAVSIPKEIAEFIHEQESKMNDMVRLAFNDAKKLSLFFGEEQEDE